MTEGVIWMVCRREDGGMRVGRWHWRWIMGDNCEGAVIKDEGEGEGGEDGRLARGWRMVGQMERGS